VELRGGPLVLRVQPWQFLSLNHNTLVHGCSRTGSALVVINVNDVNDERPQFSQKVYVFRVWENELPGTNVISLSLSLSLSLSTYHTNEAIVNGRLRPLLHSNELDQTL